MAMPPTRRHRRTKQSHALDAGAVIIRLLKQRLTQPDPRSDADFLAGMRARQAAGRLANPATAALLDRLERTIR